MTSRTHAAPRDGAPVVAGVVAALVGFSSSFVVVLAALVAVGATPDQAGSGLLALCVVQAVAMLWLAVRHRSPIALAWSTPGAALLLSTGTVTGGWPAAVGAFLATGALIVLTGLVPALGALIGRIPPALARAMLAGVVAPLCLAAVTGTAASPLLVGPVVLAWLVMHRVSRRWASPVALAVALVIVLVEAGGTLRAGELLPVLEVTTPAWSLPALVGLTLPLYVVTMASQNVPGVAVMASHGWTVPWRGAMTATGLGTAVAAPFGGHAVNLAAITAAMTAGPDAGPDRSRRWIAAVSAAVTYLLLALATPTLAALVAAAPGDVIPAAAGLALVGVLAASLSGALAEESDREAAAVTFLVAASGVVVLGVGSAFWALLVGLVARPLLRPRARPVSAA